MSENKIANIIRSIFRRKRIFIVARVQIFSAYWDPVNNCFENNDLSEVNKLLKEGYKIEQINDIAGSEDEYGSTIYHLSKEMKS